MGLTFSPKEAADELIKSGYSVSRYEEGVQARRKERLALWKQRGLPELVQKEKQLIAHGERVIELMKEAYNSNPPKKESNLDKLKKLTDHSPASPLSDLMNKKHFLNKYVQIKPDGTVDQEFLQHMSDDLNTLIQNEKDKAIRGFMGWFDSEMVKNKESFEEVIQNFYNHSHEN